MTNRFLCGNIFRHAKAYAALAQLDRVFGYEPKGRGFESLTPCQQKRWMHKHPPFLLARQSFKGFEAAKKRSGESFFCGDRRILQSYRKNRLKRFAKFKKNPLRKMRREMHKHPPFLLARQSFKGFEVAKKRSGESFLLRWPKNFAKLSQKSIEKVCKIQEESLTRNEERDAQASTFFVGTAINAQIIA